MPDLLHKCLDGSDWGAEGANRGTERPKNPGVDSAFLSTIVLSSKSSRLSLSLWQFARKKDSWKEWRRHREKKVKHGGES